MDHRLLTLDLDPVTGKDPAVERARSSMKMLGLELSKAALKLAALYLLSTALGAVLLLGVGVCLKALCLLLGLLFPQLLLP